MENYEKERKWLMLFSVVTIAFSFGDLVISKINFSFVAIENTGGFLSILLLLGTSYFLLSYYQLWVKLIKPSLQDDIDKSLCAFLTKIALNEIKERGPEIFRTNQTSIKVNNTKLIGCTDSWFVYLGAEKGIYRDVRMQLDYPCSPHARNNIGYVVYHFSAERVKRKKLKFWLYWVVNEQVFIKDMLPYVLGFLGILSLIVKYIS
jgi:hypothetical protein